MPEMADIPFGEWLPSQPDFRNPGCVEALNVIPSPGGYSPLLDLVDTGADVTGTVVAGAQNFVDNSGNPVIVGGVGTRLFTVRGTTVAQTTGLTTSALAWDFAKFNDFVIATDINNAPQYLTDIDTDDTWSAVPGSPPNARYCAAISNFLMLGNISGAPYRIQWSSYNSPATSWTASRLTQAGFADLATEFGAVQRIIGGRFGIVFQERGIHRLNYVGPPLVWSADVISKDRGTTAPFSVVNVGYLTYFLAQDGFYVTDGSSVQPIGNRRVDRWFFDTVDQANLSATQGAVDWHNQCIVWAFRGTTNSVRNRLLIYSWGEDRWSNAELTTGWLVDTNVAAVTLEGVDTLYPSGIDSVPLSLDSGVFRAGSNVLSAFVAGATDSTLYNFTGNPLRAVWETSKFQAAPGQRVFISGVRPVADADTWDWNAVLKFRNWDGDDLWSARLDAAWDGNIPVTGEGMDMSVQLVKPAGSEWNHSQGVQIFSRPAGYGR